MTTTTTTKITMLFFLTVLLLWSSSPGGSALAFEGDEEDDTEPLLKKLYLKYADNCGEYVTKCEKKCGQAGIAECSFNKKDPSFSKFAIKKSRCTCITV